MSNLAVKFRSVKQARDFYKFRRLGLPRKWVADLVGARTLWRDAK